MSLRQKGAITNITWRRIAEAIAEATGAGFEPDEVSGIGGGCINQATRISDGRRSFFVKTNRRDALAMFEAEREALEALRAPGAVKVPGPVTAGAVEDTAYLVLEFIPLSHPSGESWSRLGEQLAGLHRATGEAFGWHRDNTIGATPQVNGWNPDWIEFWRRNRLELQLELARKNGLQGGVLDRGRRLMERLDELFDGYAPAPSLLHGDLWGGNVGADAAGNPVIYDPATYYGDREADIAMSELFGRFDPGFYEAYESVWPLDPGYATRKILYNLYHVLNHYNLFGGGYGAQAGAMIDRLL